MQTNCEFLIHLRQDKKSNYSDLCGVYPFQSIPGSLPIQLQGEDLVLLPQKAMHWPKENCLLIADLHLGKGSHFRSKGIAVPQTVENKNLEILSEILKITKAKRIVFLGDLFHSSYNAAWEGFAHWLDTHPGLRFDLVVGNHDILPEKAYAKTQLVRHESLALGPFLLSHEPRKKPTEKYNLSGHIHPGIRLTGKGKQSLRLPCFFFGKRGGILPAFGQFTGLHVLDRKKSDRVFPLIESEVFEIEI